jgi:hypothetical protein
VSPLFVLALKNTSLVPVLLSHHVTYTLSPDAAILASSERPLALLRLILSSKVSPPSVLFAKNTSQLPVLLSHHVTYTLSPDAVIGAKNTGTIFACSCALAASTDCIGAITMMIADKNISIVLDVNNLFILTLSVLYLPISFLQSFITYILFSIFSFIYAYENFHKYINKSINKYIDIQLYITRITHMITAKT